MFAQNPTSPAYATRRTKLCQLIGKNGIGLLVAAPEVFRNGDTHYRYRQDSNFYYMTGFLEPEAVAVFIPGRAEGEFVLFVRPRDPSQEVWTGPRAGIEGACRDFGADQAFLISEFPKKVVELLAHREQIFFPMFLYH